MAKKNLSRAVKSIDNVSILDERGQPLTVAKALIQACMSDFAAEHMNDGLEKARRYSLGMRIHGSEEVDLSAEDIVLLKRLAGYGWPPLVVGQIYEELEK